MKNLAPICLFVYNRPDHTRQTIEALQKNNLASESNLYIFSDGAKEGDKSGKVEEVRRYIKTITGFKKIEIIESLTNKGLANSIIDGVTKIVNKYGKIIVLEDDLVTSKYFLEYMNNNLKLYENESEVISIHGYIYPINGILPKVFFLKGADCWGWATWQRGWNLFEKDGKKLLKEITNKKLGFDFDFFGTTPYLQMLKDQIKGKNNSWAIRWYASAFLENKLTLYPGKSFIQNIGLDNSGTHCGNNSGYNVLLESNKPINKKIPVEEDIKSKRLISDYFRKKNTTLKSKFINITNKTILKFKEIIKEVIPPFILKYYSKLTNKNNKFKGNYLSWEEAKKNCKGYDDDKIINKVLNSTIQVKEGKANYERDGVLFYKENYNWPLLSTLLLASPNMELNILDFGGALGSLYFQHKKFLKEFKKISWNIVEQGKYIKVGKKQIQNRELKFYKKIEEALKENNEINMILLSSVLQYMENPYNLIEEILGYDFEYIFIDRQPLIKKKDRISIQYVPKNIYDGSYPIRFLNKDKLISKFDKKYNLLATFDSLGGNIDLNDITAKYKGFIFKRKKC